jgi:hypothetical protein
MGEERDTSLRGSGRETGGQSILLLQDFQASPATLDKSNEKIKLTQIPYTNAVRTSQETHYVSVTKLNQLMLFREIIIIYSKNRMKAINTLC